MTAGSPNDRSDGIRFARILQLTISEVQRFYQIGVESKDMKDIIIGTAGHIDHGKTALVRALTGIETDRLSEEKQRGITIDIGFAHLIMGDFRVGFIDVPGHEKFVKNMLSGIGGIRLLLLVIAADESVMPQTTEHLQICNLLGIPGGIVVLTRTGLADSEMLDLVEDEAREACRGTFLETAPVARVDSISGEGIEELKAEITRQIEKICADDLSSPAMSMQVCRLPIDRVFSLKGFGTIVTGTLLSGKIGKDEQLAPYPSVENDQVYKVRSVEVFNRPQENASFGQRTALNLAGASKEELRRGMILSLPGKLRAADSLDTQVTIHSESPVSLRHRMPVRLHHGSGESIARIYLLDRDNISPGEKGLAQIRLDKPVLGFPGDRFILRRYSPEITIGGGLILQNQPSRHRRKELVKIIPHLERLADELAEPGKSSLPALISFLLRESGSSGTSLAKLVAGTGYGSDTLKDSLKKLGDRVLVSEDQLHLAWRESLEEAGSAILGFLEEHHSQHPLSGGVPRQELYERFLPGLAPPLFQKFLAEKVDSGKLTASGAKVAKSDFQVELSESHLEIRKRIEDRFKAPFPTKESPGLKDLLEMRGLGKEGKDVIYHMISSGELVRISDSLLVTPAQLRNITETMQNSFPPGIPFKVPAFKDIFGLSRKHAIPLLEHFDLHGVTIRRGDKRVMSGKQVQSDS